MVTETKSVSLGRIPFQAGQARLSFEWSLDRYRQELQWRGSESDSWHTLLTSIEGMSQDLWPPSPALQTCHVVETPAGNQIAATGSAGTAYWSLAVAQDTSRNDDGNTDSAAGPWVGWNFQVVIRIPMTELSQATTRFGSQYRTSGRPQLDTESTQCLYFGDHGLRVAVALHPQSAKKTPGNASSLAMCAQDLIRISPIVPSWQHPPQTVTLVWEYRLQVSQVSA